MGVEAYADYRTAIHDPETVHGMIEDYKAGLGIDRQHDDDDRSAGRKLECPLLVLWSSLDGLEELHGDIIGIWREWSFNVQGKALHCDHHMAEEVPEELAAELGKFFEVQELMSETAIR